MRILQFLASFALAVIVTASLFAEESVGEDSSTSAMTFTKTGPVKIIETKGWPRWLAAVGNDTLYVILPIERCSTLTLLKENSIYTFVYKREQNKYYLGDLIYVVKGADTIYDHGICPVHHQRMRSVSVPVEYGYLFHPSDDPPPYGYGCEFPYRLVPYIEGGCVVTDTSRSFADIVICAACDSAYKVWESLRGARKPERR